MIRIELFMLFGIVCLIRQRIFVIKSKGLKSQLQSGENKKKFKPKKKKLIYWNLDFLLFS